MVAKLLKYDLQGYMRSLLPMYLITLAIAITNRLTQLFESDTTVYGIIFTSSCILLGVACVVTLVMTVVLVIVMFYKNMFTREGYLSFTLPVSVHEHLAAKGLGALIMSAVSVLVIVLALSIATLGEMLSELWKAFIYMWRVLSAELIEEGAHGLGLWAVEFAALVVVSIIAAYFFYCMCICIGQLAKKNRVLAAFGVFFAFYVAAQILGTILILIVSLNPEFLEVFVDWIDKLRFAAVDLFLISSTVLTAIGGVVSYFVCHYIMSRKLNLE